MAKIILSFRIDKEPGCKVYELRDARKIVPPVGDVKNVDRQSEPVEGEEYYARVSSKQYGPTELWAGIARYAGREIPCREAFANLSASDDPAITPEDEQMYDKFVCLEKAGGKSWATPDRSKRRVYFNSDVMAEAIGLDVEYYNTGNVSSATFDGDSISNTQAKKIISRLNDTKLWYDADDSKFHFKGQIDTDEFTAIVDHVKKARDEECPGLFPKKTKKA